MSTKTKGKIFGRATKEIALQEGKKNRRRFLSLVETLSSFEETDKYSHTYIFGHPGVGKTYSIKKQLDETQTKYILVTGNVSLFAFGIQLAVINFKNINRERIVVFVDDCDVLFSTESSCNTMKNVLDGSKTFTYEKSLQSQWSNLTDIQKEAIKFHQDPDLMGFSVPTENMVFVFASNFKLPIDDQVRLAREKNQSKTILLTHKNAIRSRCNVADFDLSHAALWGWIADVVMNTECLNRFNITESDKETILGFIWENWESLTERSIRLVEKMATILKKYPGTYQSYWTIDFLK